MKRIFFTSLWVLVIVFGGFLAYIWITSLPLSYYPPPLKISLILDPQFSKKISENYLSFSLDLSQVVGKNWWADSGKFEYLIGQKDQPPFDFNRPQLIEYARNLKPAYLRLGGSMADKLDYFSESPHREAHQPLHYVLTKNILDDALSFSKKIDAKVIFDISSDPRKWDQSEDIQLDDYAKLFDYFKNNSDQLYAFEFGNEIAIHGLFYGYKNIHSSEQYAKNFLKLKEFAKTYGLGGILWAGPSNPYWPIIGEWFKPILNSSENFAKTAKNELDILTWHYYPTQSLRCGKFTTRAATAEALLDPKSLSDVAHWAEQIRDIRDRYDAKARLWLDETSSAQCGGQKLVSDRFVSTLWWIDHLSQLALIGHDVVIRQVLSGADYGLLRDADLKPRPDYWASVIWKNLIGTKVLKLAEKSEWPWLRSYAYCGKNKN